MTPEPSSAPLTIDDLLQEEQWLGGFVRRLVGPADADDVIQDTWLAALRSPPRHRGAVRTWLGRVARNFAHQLGRGRKRRRDCETMVARSEAVPSTEATVDRLATVAVLLEAVMALDEPYRSAVLLRHYHRLPIREVAARTGVAEPTARQHVKRGLDRVRRRLRERYGGDWRGAVHLLTVGGAQSLVSPVSVVTVGVMLMSKQFVLGSVAALALGGLALTLYSDGTDPGAGASAAGERRPASGGDRAPAAPSASSARRAPVERTAVATAPPAVAAPAAGLVQFSGRVLDVRGQPVAGVELLGRAGGKRSPVAESDALGRFGLASLPYRNAPVVDDGFFTVRGHAQLPPRESKDDLLYVVAPRVGSSGAVVDPRGNPLTDVTVTVEMLPLLSFPEPLSGTLPVAVPGCEVDAFGCFELADLPGGSSRLRFAKAGFETGYHDVPARSERGAQVVLRALEGELCVLTGRVLDPDELEVPGAVVGFGEVTAHSDEYGAYRIEYDPAQLGGGTTLYAAKVGYQTRVIEGFAPVAVGREARRDLRLQGPALTIEGVVLGPDGEPLRGASVLLWREEPIVGSVFAEDLAIDERAERSPYYTNSRAWDRTSADGAFTVPGLSEREYRLRVFHPDHLALTSEPIVAGTTGVELRYPKSDARGVRGRVIDRDGAPMSGIRVRLVVPIHESALGTSWQWGSQLVETGADGRFALASAPGGGRVSLSFNGAAIVQRSRPISADDAGEIEVVVDRRCHFRVESDLSSGTIRLRDVAGEPVSITRYSGGDANTQYRRFELANGRTPVLAASERAVTLVVTSPDGERSVPIRLVAGEVTVVRL